MLTACIWGIVPLIEKLGLAQAGPVPGVFARSLGVMVGATLCALVVSPWQALAALPARSIFLLGLGGFLASFVGQLAFYHALKVGSVSQVAPLSGTYPLVAAILAWVLLREPMTLTRVLGVCLIVFGAILLRR